MLKKIICAAAAALLFFSLAFCCIDSICFDKDFYKQEYSMLNTADYVGVDQETLDEATELLRDYLKDKNDSLDMQVNIDGQTREFYNDKEKAHMADVKALYANASVAAIIMCVVGAAIFAAVIIKNKKHALKTVFHGVLAGGGAVLAFFAVIGIWAAVDFTNFWTNFHYVFFTNDLWILDPRQDLLIRMFQEQFFFDMVTKILAVFLSIFAAIMIISFIAGRKIKKYER